MADCDDMTILVGETRTDFCGGEVFLIEVASDLNSAFVNITTPWGTEDSFVEIDKGTIKEYEEDGKTYTIQLKEIIYQLNKYLCKYEVCYDEITTGTLVCNSNPTGAELYLNTDYYGNTDLTLTNVNPGTYNVKLVKPEYEDYLGSVKVEAGKTTTINAVLIPCPTECDQQFRLEDQNGNPLSGSITGEDIYPLISVPASGEATTTLIEGKTYTVTAFVDTLHIEKTFTACTDKITFQFTVIEQCTQQFRFEDQDNNSLSGTLTIGGADFDVTGNISLFLEQGREYLARAVVGDVSMQKAFTACTDTIVFQFSIVELCTQQFRLEDQNGNPLSGAITIGDVDLPVPNTGEASITLVEGQNNTAVASVGTQTKSETFTSCTDKIIFIFTTAAEQPTLTTSITSSEPYIAGTIINLKTILKSSTGVPISGKSVFFYRQTEYLGGDFTNELGEITLPFQTGTTPSTYEIHSTHMTDDEIFVESNHITFTTEEAAVEPCNQSFRLEDQDGNTISGIITVGGEDHHIPATGEISIHLTEGQNYVAVAKVGTLMKQHSFIACTPQIIFIFTIEEYTPTSLSISIDPTEIGPSQYTDITGKLTIQGQDNVPPGIPLKLYCDKGQGYQVISTPTTPPSGTGIVTYHYGAQLEDAGKTLRFKYGYDGSDSLKLNPSESTTADLTVTDEPVLIKTTTTLSVSPAEIKPSNTITLKAKITEEETGDTLPVGIFVHFSISDKYLGISGTIADGYAYVQFKIPAYYIGPYICKAKFDGIANKYDPSESTFNINVNPECVEHETESECTDAECHWWTDNTCKGYAEPPPEATGSIGFIIKPNAWYKGNTEQAVIDLTAKTTDIISSLTKYFTSFIDIELISIDIYQDKNIDRVILKIYYKESGIQTMVPPAALAAMAVGAIAAIFVVTAIVGWIESWFVDDDIDHPTTVPKDEIIDAGQGGIDGAEDDAARNVYEIDDEDANTLNDCLATAETEADIAECYGLVVPTEKNTDDNAETFGIAQWTAALAVLYTLCESLNEQIYCDKADELDTTLNAALTEFRAGTITKERFILTVTQELNAIDNFLEEKEEEAKEDYATDQCFIVNPGYPLTSDNPCIITNTQAVIGGTVIGLGILGLYLIRR